MRAFILFILGVVICATGQSQTTRELKEFAGLQVSGNIRLELIPGAEHKAIITMIKGDEKEVITEVKGGTLHVKMNSKYKFGRSNAKAEIKLYYTSLDEVGASAGCSVRALQSVKAKSLQLSASSGSTLNLNVEAAKIEGSSSSGSTLSLTGKVQDVSLDASSGSTLDADRLESATAQVSVSSGANLDIWATKKLVADASSGGSISYKGEPEQFEKKGVSSGGSVRKK